MPYKKRWKLESLPNILSFGRIILSFVLIFFEPLTITFYIIYIVCGLSDILDGIITRKLAITSEFGARLDSIADFIMICLLIVLLYPRINPSKGIIIWVVCICLIRFVSASVALKKYKKTASLHTYGNKLTGIILFIFPLLGPVISSIAIMIFICIIASFSALEELIIQITSSQLHLDRHSIIRK